tara:strand:- start:17 stop:196 length:180 start_codon:yes stop_codon:yes gene_type:complete
MNYKNEFNKLGCEILDYYNKISVIIKDKKYLICNKELGKTNYDIEIKKSFLEAKKKGLI